MLANNTTTIQTNSGQRPKREADIVGAIFFCILSVMIVFGNSLVIGAFRVNRRLRTKTNLLLISLAIADLLIGTISLPLWIYTKFVPDHPQSLYNFYLPFDIVCGVSSILNLTAISLERCYALLHPIKHRNIRKSKFFNYGLSSLTKICYLIGNTRTETEVKATKTKSCSRHFI